MEASGFPACKHDVVEERDVRSELENLKKLYGLLDNTAATNCVTNNEQILDHKSRFFLLKLLDEATQDTLTRQIKTLPGPSLIPQLAKTFSIKRAGQSTNEGLEQSHSNWVRYYAQRGDSNLLKSQFSIKSRQNQAYQVPNLVPSPPYHPMSLYQGRSGIDQPSRPLIGGIPTQQCEKERLPYCPSEHQPNFNAPKTTAPTPKRILDSRMDLTNSTLRPVRPNRISPRSEQMNLQLVPYKNGNKNPETEEHNSSDGSSSSRASNSRKLDQRKTGPSKKDQRKTDKFNKRTTSSRESNSRMLDERKTGPSKKDQRKTDNFNKRTSLHGKLPIIDQKKKPGDNLPVVSSSQSNSDTSSKSSKKRTLLCKRHPVIDHKKKPGDNLPAVSSSQSNSDTSSESSKKKRALLRKRHPVIDQKKKLGENLPVVSSSHSNSDTSSESSKKRTLLRKRHPVIDHKKKPGDNKPVVSRSQSNSDTSSESSKKSVTSSRQILPMVIQKPGHPPGSTQSKKPLQHDHRKPLQRIKSTNSSSSSEKKSPMVIHKPGHPPGATQSKKPLQHDHRKPLQRIKSTKSSSSSEKKLPKVIQKPSHPLGATHSKKLLQHDHKKPLQRIKSTKSSSSSGKKLPKVIQKLSHPLGATHSKRQFISQNDHNKSLRKTQDSCQELVSSQKNLKKPAKEIDIPEQKRGRFGRLKDKLAVVLHHHHDHHHYHHHQSKEDGSSKDQDDKKRHHVHRSLWKFFKGIVHHSSEKPAEIVPSQHLKHKHMRALFHMLFGHLRGNGRKKKAWLGRAVSRVRVKKLHWWQKFRRHGPKKLTNGKNARRKLPGGKVKKKKKGNKI